LTSTSSQDVESENIDDNGFFLDGIEEEQALLNE